MFWENNQHHSSSVSVYTAVTSALLPSNKQENGGMQERNDNKNRGRGQIYFAYYFK